MSKHEQAESLFKNKLLQIASCSLIDERDFEKLLYGCKDVIPDGDRERITSLSSLFQELKKRGKLNVDNREFLVDLLNTIGHKKFADDLLEILTCETIEKLKNQGRVAFKEQKFCKARDAYCEALQLIPPSYSQNSVIAKEWQPLTLKWVRCLIQLGNVNCDHSYFKQAYDVCVNELLKQDPEDLRAKFLLAESLDGLEQYDDAYKELKILLKVKPMNPDVLFLYKKVEKIKFEDNGQSQDEPRSAIPQQLTSSSGDAYPRKILLVCDKWSGWHLSLYAVNRHLCQSFGKQKGVQVACLVLDATEADTCKALRNNIHLIKAASKSGVLAGDRRLLFMHDCFPFDEPDLVIGHGMVTGVEAAELARRFKCKYLQILYDPPEECTNSDESRSKEEAEKQAELGRDADFVAAIGPHLALEWSNTLNRSVMELIPGIPHVTERNSIPTPNNRCLIVKTDEARQVGLDLAIQALNDCKRRSRPVNINIQGTPRSKRDELQSFLENKLWRSKFDIRVTSHDASIESVRGEISAVSLMIMPEQSHAFGVRGLEAIGAGVPILISNTYGLAHILLKYFDEKFWKFVCATDEEDDYESWSERIDAFFDDRDEYFRLALELREEWNKIFSWGTSVIHICNDLSMSGCFEKVATQDAINEKLQIPLYSKEALEFVKKELQLDEKRRKHILVVSPTKCQEVSSVSNLSKVPWISVFDFDVNSAKTGFLACCEKLANEMGMKICRIVSPEPGERKRKVILPNGVPWILLEGKPESKRNMNECLDWLRSILASIESSYQAPITILVLWNSCEENGGLTKKLAKFFVLIESLNLKERIKLSIVTTNDDKPSILKDIEEDWGITARSFSLSDVGYAINDIVSERPLVCESLDFALPVAIADGSVSVEVLPLESRWVNAELEVLYQTVGDTPEHGSEDANHFYRGGTISWYALNSGYAIERESWEPIKLKIDELLTTAGTLRQTLPHSRGTGGTTSARKILFDYHKKYPCVNVKSINLSETAPAIKALADFCKRPVLVLIDCKHVQGQEFELEMLYNNLSTSRVPCILLEIVHYRGRQVSNGRKELRAAEKLSNDEADNFVQIYTNLRKEKTSFLNKLRKDENEELQIPFYYALVTFEERFLGLEPFVEDCINGSNKQQRQVLIFLALAHHYGHTSISEATLTTYLNAPIGILLDDVLTKESMQLLIEEDGEWRPRHDLIGSKMLEKLLTYQEPDSPVRIHNDYWIQRVADEAITFIDVMPETPVSGLLLNRISSNEKHSNVFSPLINDIPDEDDAIRVFEKAIDLFPDNMFFKVHLGRFYSITKKAAGFSMAIQYTDKGIACADSDTSRVVRSQFAQMKGIVFSRQVNYLKNDRAKINEVIKFAEKGVKWFRRAVSICPDMVDAYIPEVNMMCKLFEYIDKETGSVHKYLQQPNCHPFIVDGISQTLDTLECVPDCENYSVWKVRILNLGLRKSRRRMEETLLLLEQLRNGKRASIGLVNRHIVSTKMEICRQHKRSLASIAREVMDLLNEALACDKDGMERTMCIWVKIAPVVPVSLQEAENRIFKWCTKMKSLRSYLYQYIIAFINVLDKGRRDHVDLLRSTYQELNNTIKAISRKDIGIVQHPVKAVVWLGQMSNHMDQLVYLNVPSSASTQRRTVLPIEYTTKLRRFTGTITSTDPKLGTISVDGLPNKIKFRTDLCDPQLTSATFANRKVEFFLCFNFFGVNPYNVRIIDE